MTLDSTFASHVREQLIGAAAGTSALAIRTHRLRAARGIGIGLSAAAMLTAGALVVSTVLPGEDIVTPLGNAIAEQHTGTATVELGVAPDAANAVKLTLTCTSAGIFSLTYPGTYGPSGASVRCGDDPAFEPTDPQDPMYGMPSAEIGHELRMPDMPIEPGATSFVVTVTEGSTWTITAEYVNTVTTPWGVNANGQTYGVPHEDAVPDLLPAQATNGEIGYIFGDDLWSDGEEPHTIPVYKSDGETVIGQFPIGDSCNAGSPAIC